MKYAKYISYHTLSIAPIFHINKFQNISFLKLIFPEFYLLNPRKSYRIEKRAGTDHSSFHVVPLKFKQLHLTTSGSARGRREI